MRLSKKACTLLFGVMSSASVGCSAGQTNSIDQYEAGFSKPISPVASQAEASPKATDEKLQNALKKSCEFVPEDGLVSDLMKWESDNQDCCFSLCNEKKPVGVVGICHYLGAPLGVNHSSRDLSQTTNRSGVLSGNSTGNTPIVSVQDGMGQLSDLKPGQVSAATLEEFKMHMPTTGCSIVERIPIQQAASTFSVQLLEASTKALCSNLCENKGLSQQADKGVCAFEGKVLLSFGNQQGSGQVSDNGETVGTCRLEFLDNMDVKNALTSMKSRAECASECTDRAGQLNGIKCLFNDVAFFGVEVLPSFENKDMKMCDVSVYDAASQTTTTTEALTPGVEACAVRCKAENVDTVSRLNCSYDNSPLVSIDFGDSLVDTEMRTCSTSKSNDAGTQKKSKLTSQTECIQLCTTLSEADDVDSMTCKFSDTAN